MAQLDENRKKMESVFMADFWNLRKQIGTPEEDQNYWKEVYEKITEMEQKYNHDLFVNCMILAFTTDLESRSKYYARGDKTLYYFNHIRKARGLLPVAEVTNP